MLRCTKPFLKHSVRAVLVCPKSALHRARSQAALDIAQCHKGTTTFTTQIPQTNWHSQWQRIQQCENHYWRLSVFSSMKTITDALEYSEVGTRRVSRSPPDYRKPLRCVQFPVPLRGWWRQPEPWPEMHLNDTQKCTFCLKQNAAC
jgi:hypothetical protein